MVLPAVILHNDCSFLFSKMEAAVCCNPLIITDQEFPLRSQMLLDVPVNIKIVLVPCTSKSTEDNIFFSFFQSASLTVAIHICLFDSLVYKIICTQ